MGPPILRFELVRAMCHRKGCAPYKCVAHNRLILQGLLMAVLLRVYCTAERIVDVPYRV
jgi:hypothetical protein